MKKRGFVLIELFIALALIALAIIPIIAYPLKIYYDEISNFRKIEIESLYDLVMAEYVKKLSKCTWDTVLEGHEMEFESLVGEGYKARVEIEVEKEAGDHRLLKCVVRVGKFERAYNLHIHKNSGTHAGTHAGTGTGTGT